MSFSKLDIDLASPQVRFALDVILFGAELSSRVRAGSSVRSMTKHDHSPVTIADMGIQAIAGALLERYFPDACLVAEETSAPLKAAGGKPDLDEIVSLVKAFFPDAAPDKVCRWIDHGTAKPRESFWILDPIDGTKGFLRGGQYATAIAFIDNGKIELSALGCPELEMPGHPQLGKGVMLLAARGKGCWMASLKDQAQWVRARVSDRADITQARILDSFDPNHKNSEKNALIKKMLGVQPEPMPMDSQAKHAVLAAGGAEIFFRTLPRRDPGYREKIWDVAPGAFAIEEAGGCVTDLSGEPIDYSTGILLEKNPGFLATNGKFHAAVLGKIKESVAALSNASPKK